MKITKNEIRKQIRKAILDVLIEEKEAEIEVEVEVDCDPEESEEEEDKKEVSLDEFKNIVRRMIIEESADVKRSFLAENFHPRGDSQEFQGYSIPYLEKDLGVSIKRMPDTIDHGYTLAFIPQGGTYTAGVDGQKPIEAGYYFCDEDCNAVNLDTRFETPEEAYREAGNREDLAHSDDYAKGPGGFEQWDDPYYSRDSDAIYRENKNVQEIFGHKKIKFINESDPFDVKKELYSILRSVVNTENAEERKAFMPDIISKLKETFSSIREESLSSPSYARIASRHEMLSDGQKETLINYYEDKIDKLSNKTKTLKREMVSALGQIIGSDDESTRIEYYKEKLPEIMGVLDLDVGSLFMYEELLKDLQSGTSYYRENKNVQEIFGFGKFKKKDSEVPKSGPKKNSYKGSELDSSRALNYVLQAYNREGAKKAAAMFIKMKEHLDEHGFEELLGELRRLGIYEEMSLSIQ